MEVKIKKLKLLLNKMKIKSFNSKFRLLKMIIMNKMN